MRQNPFQREDVEVRRSYHGVHDGRFTRLWPEPSEPTRRR